MVGSARLPGFLIPPTRYLFFTRKGGVGKTSVSTAAALTLADAGQKVLLVSTDAASNLDEMLGIELRNTPTAVTRAPGLWVLNIDPDTAAESYRQRVLAQLDLAASDTERATVREQLSGACTTEIASFDEFASLLSDAAPGFDHIVFDTAPTGHTLRLLSLPKAWSGFLQGNDRGASCLGPHAGLMMQEARFKAALDALSDPRQTTVILVTRPDKGALDEAARTSEELRALGLQNQRLVVNGEFRATDRSDAVACAIEALGQQALAELPRSLRDLPQDGVPLRAFGTVGLPALRALLGAEADAIASVKAVLVEPIEHFAGLAALADELAAREHGLIMVMGKGGVGKTTVAAALALGLTERGKTVHLSTTDPAAHLVGTLRAEVPGLRVDRIDPKVETQRYTAPTGHSLLLMDATGACHRQMMREFDGRGAGRVVTPPMRLRAAEYTRIILVALPEVTPVSQAAALQDDLRRAGIEPCAWVLNKSVLAAGTHDPLLAARLAGERKQMARMSGGLARRLFTVPWLTRPPIGFVELSRLVRREQLSDAMSSKDADASHDPR